MGGPISPGPLPSPTTRDIHNPYTPSRLLSNELARVEMAPRTPRIAQGVSSVPAQILSSRQGQRRVTINSPRNIAPLTPFHHHQSQVPCLSPSALPIPPRVISPRTPPRQAEAGPGPTTQEHRSFAERIQRQREEYEEIFGSPYPEPSINSPFPDIGPTRTPQEVLEDLGMRCYRFAQRMGVPDIEQMTTREHIEAMRELMLTEDIELPIQVSEFLSNPKNRWELSNLYARSLQPDIREMLPDIPDSPASNRNTYLLTPAPTYHTHNILQTSRSSLGHSTQPENPQNTGEHHRETPGAGESDRRQVVFIETENEETSSEDLVKSSSSSYGEPIEPRFNPDNMVPRGMVRHIDDALDSDGEHVVYYVPRPVNPILRSMTTRSEGTAEIHISSYSEEQEGQATYVAGLESQTSARAPSCASSEPPRPSPPTFIPSPTPSQLWSQDPSSNEEGADQGRQLVPLITVQREPR
ncbi:hypothetical protein VNI00_012196 [Paramarasmius palmivorus]|uniref:Uncharacterized protein n=1 Tax=Paramarasmius palmivorus TaxID=297713 RepID=A0AAW0C8L5_9AGAR